MFGWSNQGSLSHPNDGWSDAPETPPWHDGPDHDDSDHPEISEHAKALLADDSQFLIPAEISEQILKLQPVTRWKWDWTAFFSSSSGSSSGLAVSDEIEWDFQCPCGIMERHAVGDHHVSAHCRCGFPFAHRHMWSAGDGVPMRTDGVDAAAYAGQPCGVVPRDLAARLWLGRPFDGAWFGESVSFAPGRHGVEPALDLPCRCGILQRHSYRDHGVGPGSTDCHCGFPFDHTHRGLVTDNAPRPVRYHPGLQLRRNVHLHETR